MVVFCCGEYHIADEKKKLCDTSKLEDRYIEVLTCPKCGKKKAKLSQHIISTGKCVEKFSKKGKADKYIKKWMQDYLEEELKVPKNGSITNMYWVYFNGTDLTIRDFNNIEKSKYNSPLKLIRA